MIREPRPPARAPRRRRLPGGQPGVEIALLDWGGRGPLALLHHANGFCAGTWGEVAEALGDDFHVVALDARGHGDSSRPEDPEAYAWERFVDDLLAVAEALAREAPDGRVALGVGHSFGGVALLMAAARRPGLFGALLAVDPVIRDPAHARRAAAESGGALAERARERRTRWASREEALGGWDDGHPFFGSWTPRARELYARFGLRDLPGGGVELCCAPEVEAAVFERGGSLDPFPVAGAIRAPALLLHAARGSFSRETYARLARAMPRARVESVDAGHLLPMERPERVSEAARRIAREAGAVPGGTQDSTG